MSQGLAPGCAAVDDDLAELALGSLAGRQRAAALAHLERCPRCGAEVDKLSAVADELAHLVPAVEPPVGFEARVSERLRPPAPRSRWPAWLAWRRPALALGALAVLAAVGLGTLAVHQATSPGPHGPGGRRGYQRAPPPRPPTSVPVPAPWARSWSTPATPPGCTCTWTTSPGRASSPAGPSWPTAPPSRSATSGPQRAKVRGRPAWANRPAGCEKLN